MSMLTKGPTPLERHAREFAAATRPKRVMERVHERMAEKHWILFQPREP